MTVSSTTTRNSYSGNGSTTTFAYGFKIFADADLTVILRASTGAETVQSLTTNYTVTNAGNASGGNVVFGTAPASGVTVVIRRNMAQTQSTDYTANDPFPAESHEDALDRLTFIAQQQQEEVDRSLKLSRTNTMTSTEFTVGATDRASKVLAFDSSGELSVTQELGTFKGTDATVTTAAYVERDIIKSTTTAELNNVYICVAASVVGDALTDTDHFSLLVDAVSAASSATTATTKATAAASSATAAASSASTASTQASNASTSASTASTQATNAASSATAAQTAQAAAEAALDTFDDRFLGAKSSDPSVDNDGNALIDGALYFDTTNDIMKVYDLTNTQWRQLTLTSTNQTNVNTVAGAISNVNTVAGSISNINTANSNITNIDTVAGISSNVTTVAGISSNVTTVAGISSNVTSVAGNSSNINSAVSNATNINTVAGAVTNVNTVASNISGVNSFADRYRVASSAPSSSLDVGDLYFDTTANELKVYKSSGWAAAGSTVNGTSARFHYNISGTPTSVTGSDAAGNTLAYDAGFIDVYVNGVRMSTADVTVTSGDTVTFESGALADGDEVDIVAFGTFAVANIVSTGALNSGSITSGFGNIDTGSSTITTTGVGTFGSLDISGDIDVDGTTNLDAVDMASTLQVDGAITSSTGMTITTADNNPQLTIISTDADASRGAMLDLVRNSASPSDNDLCGTIRGLAKNSVGEDVTLGEIIFRNEDVTDGTEDGQIILNMMRNGASAQVMKLSSTETVLNGDSLDLDFRIESDNNANAFFVEGSTGNVGIGNSNPSDFGSLTDNLVIGTTSGENGMTIVSGTGNSGRIQFSDNTSSPFRGAIEYSHGSNDSLIFYTAGSSRMTITSSGQLVFPIADTTSDGANLNIRTSDGLFRRSTSSRRFKNTINDATHGLTELLQLRSVTFKGNNDGDKIFGGLIAEEVHDAGLTEFVQYNTDNEPDALAYGNMVSLCIKAIQELSAQVTALETENKTQATQIADLISRVTALESA